MEFCKSPNYTNFNFESVPLSRGSFFYRRCGAREASASQLANWGLLASVTWMVGSFPAEQATSRTSHVLTQLSSINQIGASCRKQKKKTFCSGSVLASLDKNRIFSVIGFKYENMFLNGSDGSRNREKKDYNWWWYCESLNYICGCDSDRAYHRHIDEGRRQTNVRRLWA